MGREGKQRNRVVGFKFACLITGYSVTRPHAGGGLGLKTTIVTWGRVYTRRSRARDVRRARERVEREPGRDALGE
jgi:hypothetical protein